MRRERRQPTRAEWAAITSRRPVVRRVLERRPQSSRPENRQSAPVHKAEVCGPL
jgi:hypothetical protein